MAPTLENGWPKVLGVSGPTAEDRSGSLQYLFDPGMAVDGKDVYAVGRGGSTGLFQRDGEGYLYYDSLQMPPATTPPTDDSNWGIICCAPTTPSM